jgi:3-methyl-2-oxobutanoate hydroxymethyltransferase
MKNYLEFAKFRSQGRKITMLTAYDYWTAKILSKSSVDCLLVGDSCAMVMHGHKDTLAATTELMTLHTRAVRLGAPDLFIVGDLPFLTYRGSRNRALDCVLPIMQAGAQAVKLEGSHGNLKLIRHLVSSGVPVMGHLGLTPQSVHALGGYRVQNRGDDGLQLLLQAAQELEQAGCFSIVLECVPEAAAQAVTEKLGIPTIGIGAGIHVDGQVLVLQDMLGAQTDFQPKFVRRFADLAGQMAAAIDQFVGEVQNGTFPSEKESYQ